MHQHSNKWTGGGEHSLSPHVIDSEDKCRYLGDHRTQVLTILCLSLYFLFQKTVSRNVILAFELVAYFNFNCT